MAGHIRSNNMSHSTVALFDSLHTRHQHQINLNSFTSICYQLGKHIVRVNYSDQLHIVLGESLAHLAVDPLDAVHLEIDCLVMDEHWKMPFAQTDYQIQGLLAGYNDSDHFAAFQFGASVFSFYDRTIHRGYYVIEKVNALPFWEKGSPFRSIFHWWTETTSYQLIHAAYLDYNGTGVLLSGKGGSGKSSTTVGALLKGRKTLGDDYLLMDTADGWVYSLYQTSKLDKNALERFPQLTTIINADVLAHGEKALIAANSVAPDAIQREGKASIHLLPKINHSTTSVIKHATGADALRTLAPSTIFQLPGLHELTFKKCSAICRMVPVYEILLSVNSEEIDQTIDKFVKGT